MKTLSLNFINTKTYIYLAIFFIRQTYINEHRFRIIVKKRQVDYERRLIGLRVLIGALLWLSMTSFCVPVYAYQMISITTVNEF